MKQLKELRRIIESTIDSIEKRDNLNESIQSDLRAANEEIKKLEEKPKIKTVRDLEEGDEYWFVAINGRSHNSTKDDCIKYYMTHLSKKEAQRRALRDRIECELDCDSRIAWGDNKERDSHFISFFNHDDNELSADNNSNDGEKFSEGLFGAVNFPTKESLIESINTHRELIQEYFDVDSFKVV